MKAMSFGVSLLFVSLASAQVQPPPRRGAFPGQAPVVNTDPLANPPRPTAAAPLDLSGAWRGIYWSDDEGILAELDLTTDAAKRTLTGELRFTTLPPSWARIQARKGSSPVNGLVDPGARTVLLLAPAGIRPQVGLLAKKDVRIHAVYSAERGELAGQFYFEYDQRPGMPYFVFARAAAADGIQALTKHAASIEPVLRASGKPPSDEALAQWSARLIEEYGLAGIGTSGDQISKKALPLLNDATFKPVFGASYDAIDIGKLAAGMHRAGGIVAGASGKPNLQFAREHGYVQYMLWPSAPKLVSVAAMRVTDAWQAELFAHFEHDAPVASAYDDLAAVQKAAQERMEYAFPSTRKAADEAFERLRTTMAVSVLAASVERALGEAKGEPGARALAAWAKDNAVMLTYCSPTDRAAAQQRIDAQLDVLLGEQLAEPLAKMQQLAGAGVVRAGADWYRALLARFSFAAERPPVRQATERLAGRRGPDIAGAQESYAQRITACQTTAEVDALFEGDLSVPGDETQNAFLTLAELARDRKHKIQEAMLMSLFSADEKQYMDRPGHIDLAKGRGKPPSPESVRLALLRGYAAGTGTMIDAHTARSVTRQFSPLFIPFSAQFSMSNERFTSAPLVSEEGDEWLCEYTILLQVAIPQDNVIASYDAVVRKGVDDQAKLINAFLQAMSGEPSQEVFRLYEDGWGVPRMREIGGAEAVLDALLKSR